MATASRITTSALPNSNPEAQAPKDKTAEEYKGLREIYRIVIDKTAQKPIIR